MMTIAPLSRIREKWVGPSPRIAVDFCGHGDLVLFLHGIGGNRLNWRRQLDCAAPYFTAAALDARGYGDSDDYDGAFTPEASSEDVVRVIDSFDAKQAHLIGLSMGGRIAQEVYHRWPNRVASLTLANTSPALARVMPIAQARALIESRRKPLLEGKSPAELAPAIARSLVSERACAGALEEVAIGQAALRPSSYLKALDALLSFDRESELSQIHVPVHIITGMDDRSVQPAVAEAMARQIAGARLTVIPDAGHLSNVDQPAAFNRSFLGFLLLLQSSGSL